MIKELYRINRKFVFPCLVIMMIAGMMFSLFLLSLSQILFIALIITEGHWKEKLNSLKKPLPWLLASVFFIHVIGLAWTNDWAYALKDLRVKLPLFIIPVSFAIIGPLTQKSWNFILKSFQLIVIILFLFTMITYLFSTDFSLSDWKIYRNHIRLSLLFIILVIWSLHDFFTTPRAFFQSIISLAAISFAVILIVAISSLNGIILLVLGMLMIAFLTLRQKMNLFSITYWLTLSIFVFSLIYTVGEAKKKYFAKTDDIEDPQSIDYFNQNNRMYINMTDVELRENGHRVYFYIQPQEMVREWNKRSQKKIDSINLLSDDFSAKIMRYITSKGLRKDSAGIAQLTETDIKNIEKGCVNVHLANASALEHRLYALLYEYGESNDISNINGSSVRQRFLYWKIASMIISENKVFGVGTGDVSQAFNDKYKNEFSKIELRFRYRAHNQYLEIAVALGISGLLVFVFAILSPFVIFRKTIFRHYSLWVIFFVIFAVSLLSEDTLETQVGVGFYSIFNALFLFFIPKEKEK